MISATVNMLAAKLTFILVFVLPLIDVHSFWNNVNSVKIVHYYGPTYKDHQSYDLDKVASILEHPKFIHNQTNLYMHGYKGSQKTYSVHLIVDSYLKRDSMNLLTIDWKVLASGSYISAQKNLLSLAPRVADSILKLFDGGLDSDSFSLVGHSLGGLGVGVIGREIFSKTNGNVLLPRITALDPSNAAAHADFILPPVEKTDAKFVDVIHTDAGGRGSTERMGHADFWPNRGKAIQPGCPAPDVNYFCSHLKAWAYWAQSVAIVAQEQLLAYPAQSYDDFLENGTANSNDTALLMGVDCPMNASGDYYLQINSDYGSLPVVELYF